MADTNPYAQFAQPNPYAQFTQTSQGAPDRDQLSRAFYNAMASGDRTSARNIIGQIQKAGLTLAPMSSQQEQAAFQRGNAANVAAMSGWDRFDAGMGKAVVDTGRGIGQLVGAESPQDIQNAREADAALANSTQGKLGDIAGQGLMLAMPGTDLFKGAGMLGKAAPYANAALKMGAFSGAQPVADGESRGVNTAEGAGLGIVGEALPAVLGAGSRAAAPSLSEAQQQAIATAQAAGIPLHLNQVTNSRFLKVLGSAAKALPASGTAAADEAQRQAWNRALASTMGEDASELTPQLVARAKQTAGNDYNRIFGANSVDMDHPTMDALATAQAKAHGELLPEHAALVDQQIDRILNTAADNGGAVPGAKYQDLRNSLKDSATANPALTHHLGAVRSALEDAASRQIPDLAPVNARYNNIKTIERGLKQVGGANNTIAPANLYHLTQGKFGATPQMRALAQLGQTVIKDPVANSSNTAAHMMMYRGMYNPLTWGPLAAFGTLGATAGRVMNSPFAARTLPYLGQNVLGGAARLTAPAPRLLPLLATMPPSAAAITPQQ